MNSNRVVHWLGPAPAPAADILRWVAEDYIGDGVGSVSGWWTTGSGFSIDLFGAPSWPLRSVPHPLHVVPRSPYGSDRWIEVHVGEDCVDVLTRQMDEVTNVIASGLACLYARAFAGRLTDTSMAEARGGK